MSYSKPTGLWVTHHAALYDDPRTLAAADYLVEHKVPRYVAVQVVVTAWLRLHVHALGEGDDGLTGHLSDRRLIGLAWPEAADAPRNLGRMERLGGVLRTALHQVPHGHDEGLMLCTCAAECAQRRPLPGRTVLHTCAQHEQLTGWEELHSKILGDRRRLREKRAAKAAQRPMAGGPVVTVSHDTPAPVVRQPAPRRATVAGTPNPQTHTDRDSPQPPAVENLPPSGPRPAGDLVQEALEGTGAEAPGGRGAARASSLPGAQEGTREVGDHGERAAHLILGAAPNVVGQQRNGRDTTCRPGSYYLLRLGALSVALQGELSREVGAREPAPGRLLALAAPKLKHRDRWGRDLYEQLVANVARKLPEVRKPEAYVRSSLAKAWADLLGRLADELAEDRYRDRGVGAG